MLIESGQRLRNRFRRRIVSFVALGGLLAAPSLASAQQNVTDIPAPVRRLNPGITQYSDQYLQNNYSGQVNFDQQGQFYGQSNYGQVNYSPSNYGNSNCCGQSNYGQMNYSQSNYGQSNCCGQSNYGQMNYGQSNCCGQSTGYGYSQNYDQNWNSGYVGQTSPYQSYSGGQYYSNSCSTCGGGQFGSGGYYETQQGFAGYSTGQNYNQPYSSSQGYSTNQSNSGGMQNGNRAQLGISMQNNNEGVEITRVMQDSAAMDAGIQQGDVLTRINDQSVNGWQAVQQQIGKMQPGDDVELTVMRNGEEQQLQAKLGQSQFYQSARPNLDGSMQGGASGNVNSQVSQLQQEVQMLKQQIQRLQQEVGIESNNPNNNNSNSNSQNRDSSTGLDSTSQGDTDTEVETDVDVDSGAQAVDGEDESTEGTSGL